MKMTYQQRKVKNKIGSKLSGVERKGKCEHRQEFAAFALREWRKDTNRRLGVRKRRVKNS